MTIETTPTSKQICEICGKSPTDRFVRNQAARDMNTRYVKTRSNRTKVEKYYAEKAGCPEYTGKRACSTCYTAILDRANEVIQTNP